MNIEVRQRFPALSKARGDSLLRFLDLAHPCLHELDDFLL